MRRVLVGSILIPGALVVAPMGASMRHPALAAALAFVNSRCPALEREINTDLWDAGVKFNALYGNCQAGDGRDQRVWFFTGDRFVGNDAPTSSKDVMGVWRGGDTIAFLYVLYRRSDPNCCPTGGGWIVRFRWNGRHVVRLDKLPPRQLGGVPVGR
jgi:hypothetical protein